MSKREKQFKPSRPSNPSRQLERLKKIREQSKRLDTINKYLENKVYQLEQLEEIWKQSAVLKEIQKESEDIQKESEEIEKRLEQLIRDSNFPEHLISKISNFLEHIAPHNWQKSSFYFHDLVEDHRENLIPSYKEHGCEWIAHFITCWRLLFFLWHFGLSSLRIAITTRRSKL
ncbi:hypothetical protein NIES2101_43255 [Calothrix sp. HK-06]|nr:hypothetical protein NIES2101_43255 [Calothrix sp. HK-06]